MIDLWLEMHAQTHHNAQGVASGHFDVALTQEASMSEKPMWLSEGIRLKFEPDIVIVSPHVAMSGEKESTTGAFS